MPVPLRRLAAATARAFFAKPSNVGRIRQRVRLSYVDLFLHMNYASYLEVMELGRWDWSVRSRMFHEVFLAGYSPVVVALNIEYRRELRPGASFTLDTRLVDIEEKMPIFEQHFLRGDRVHARARVKALMLHKGKVQGAAKVQELLAKSIVEPLKTRDDRVLLTR